jgi:hypothetical protein
MQIWNGEVWIGPTLTPGIPTQMVLLPGVIVPEARTVVGVARASSAVIAAVADRRLMTPNEAGPVFPRPRRHNGRTGRSSARRAIRAGVDFLGRARDGA